MRLPRRLPVLSALLTVLATGWLHAESPRPRQPEDFATLREVGDPQLSPEGEIVAYTVKTTDSPPTSSQPISGWSNGTALKITR